MADLSIVLPCYNEVDNVQKMESELLPIVEQLVGSKIAHVGEIHSVEVIFVDDGSTDGTLAALQTVLGDISRPGIKICFVQHQVNRGLGAALRTGLASAHGDVIVTTDSDGTYKFTEIPALLAYLTENIAIVTASPYHPDGGVANVPTYRLILSRGSSLLYRLIVDRHVHTYTALFRAYRREVTDCITHESDGFLGGTELLVKAILSGFRVAEYPTVLYSRVYGTSKAKLLRTIRAHLNFQATVILYRLGLKQFKRARSQQSTTGEHTWVSSAQSSVGENQS